MKIGLITIHDTLNYGSLLQTFGLYKCIESLGKDITLVDYKCKTIAKRERTFKLNECRTLSDYVRHILYHKKLAKQKDNIWNFIRSNMKVSATFDSDSIKKSNDIFDSFLVGSDIVWGMNITGHDFSYMLDFADANKKKIAFSSSVGTKWQQEDEFKIKDLLSRFEKISVREQLAADWIEELLGRKIPVTCDPTMLWTCNFWQQYASSQNIPTKNYVLVYMRTKDERNIKDAKKYAYKRGLPVYYINFDVPKLGVHNIQPLTVQDWIGLFANADTVFSASYHGLLFSLYFHKNVFYYNRGNKSRMISLCKELCIEDKEGNIKNINNDTHINYKYVDNILKIKREKSWNILKDALREI